MTVTELLINNIRYMFKKWEEVFYKWFNLLPSKWIIDRQDEDEWEDYYIINGMSYHKMEIHSTRNECLFYIRWYHERHLEDLKRKRESLFNNILWQCWKLKEVEIEINNS